MLIAFFPCTEISYTIHTLFFTPEMTTESNSCSKARNFCLILLRWFHLISVYGLCHCRDGSSREYKRLWIRTEQKRKCVHVRVFKSLTAISMQELTPLSKQRPRALHTSDSPAIISTS